MIRQLPFIPIPKSAIDAAEQQLRERIAAAPAKDREALEQQLADLTARRTTHLPLLKQLAAMAKSGTTLKLPLIGREIPLVADVWAKPELGTGCVKITPAHDPNDYEVALRCNLPMINILNTDGTLNAEAGKYKGLTIRKAREAVVADLEELGLMGDIEDRDIELAHSDRSKTPIEPFLADQWFVRMDKLAQSAMDAVTSGQVKILPERYAKSYLDWLSEKRDWPVGRQLWWGHQIPIWTKQLDTPELAASRASSACPRCHNRRPRHCPRRSKRIASCMLACATKRTRWRSNWKRLVTNAKTMCSTPGSVPRSGRTRLSAWPDKTPELDYFYPTSTLITSRDIITLWVARMVLMGLNNVGKIPFKEVYIHPKILDGYGETMSKSKGNGVDPIDVIDKFGPDALRFGLTWLATETQDVRMPVQFECPHCEAPINQTKQNRELHTIECPKCKKKFSTQWAKSAEDKALPKGAVISERFEVARNFCNKLWNASRFVMMNLTGYKPVKLDVKNLPLEDRWILSRLATTTKNVTEAIDKYQHADAARMIYDFAWDEFCSYYVEMAKPRLQDAASRPATQQVLIHTLDQLLRLLHPMTPFITEAIWQELARFGDVRTLDGDAESQKWLIRSAWPEANTAHIDQVIEQQFARFVTALGALREIRSRQNLPPKEEITFTISCDAATQKLLEPMVPFFKALAGATCTGLGEKLAPPRCRLK